MANPFTPFDPSSEEAILETVKFINDTQKDLEEAERRFNEETKEQRENLKDAMDWLQEVLLGGTINKSGTFHFGDKEGISVTYEVKKSMKVNDLVLESLINNNQVSIETVQQVFTYKPSVNGKEFAKLDEATVKVLAPAITTTYGKPSLEINIKGE